MDPRAFIGLPDWRSALLAALFALPWLVLLGRGTLRRWPLWLAVAGGVLLFPFSIAWVQAPIQQGLNLLWLRLLDVAAIQQWLLAVAVPSIAVSGLVQESAKLLVAVGALALLGKREPRAGLALGAAAGAGYGGIEAFWVLNQVFASGFTWGTVQLYGLGALLGFVERFFAVPFHIGSAALAGYGLATGRPWRFLLLAIGLHAAVNYTIVLMQAGLIGALAIEVIAALIAAATIATALWLRRRAAPVAVEH